MQAACRVEDLGNVQLEDCLCDQLSALNSDYYVLVQGDPLAMFDTKVPGVHIFVAKLDAPETMVRDFIDRDTMKRLTSEEVCDRIKQRVQSLIDSQERQMAAMAASA
jgi:hypothetical protein